MAEATQPRPRHLWAGAQLGIALLAVAWAVAVFWFPSPEGVPSKDFKRDALIPGASLAAGLFFVVAFILFVKDHPDARIVGLFGAAFFAGANIWMAVDRWNLFVGKHCDDPGAQVGPCDYPFRSTSEVDGLPDWTSGRIGATIAVTTVVVLLELTLLLSSTLWLRRERRRLEEERMAQAAPAPRPPPRRA